MLCFSQERRDAVVMVAGVPPAFLHPNPGFTEGFFKSPIRGGGRVWQLKAKASAAFFLITWFGRNRPAGAGSICRSSVLT